MAAGAVGLALVMVVLLSTPATLVGASTSYVDTHLAGRSGNAEPVAGFLDLADPEDLADFPLRLGAWEGGPDESRAGRWPRVAEYYDAEGLLVRAYSRPGLYVPLDVFILQTRQTHVFHSLEASYRAVLGMDTLSVTPVHLELNRESSEAPHLVPAAVPGSRLLVERVGADGPEERRIAYTFWVIEEDWRVPTRATWVRAELIVPANGPYDAHDALILDFMGELGARLFRVPDPALEPLVVEILFAKGPLGGLAATGSVVAPTGAMAWGIREWRRGGRIEDAAP